MEDERLERAREAFLRHMGTAWAPSADPTDPPALREFSAINFARAYGDSWSRDGLDVRTKSLVTLAVLATQRADRQFAVHVKAAEHAGVSRDEIAELLIHLGAYIGASSASIACAAARDAWAALDAPPSGQDP